MLASYVHIRLENAEDGAVSIVERCLECAVTGRARIRASSTGDRVGACDVSEKRRIEGRVVEVNRAPPLRGHRAARGGDGGGAGHDYLAAVMVDVDDGEVFVTRSSFAEGARQRDVTIERAIAGQGFVETHEQGVVVCLSAGKAERQEGDGQNGKQPCSGDECCGDVFHFVVLRFSFLL